jgi:kanamycin kinase/aminoglycoside 3'-phosphotransferase-2
MTRIFEKHEERIGALRLPANISSILRGYTFFRLVRNYPSPTGVYRAIMLGYPTLFLKVGKGLGFEKKRLSWLEGRLRVPAVVAYSSLENQEYLLLTEVPGLPADDKKWHTNIASLVELLAEEVQAIHSLPIFDCPFGASVDALMARAEKVVRFQLLESHDLSEAYRHRTINDLFSDLLQLRPENEHIVFTHGDLCLPNILIQQGVSVGFVDLGLAGLSDHHRDLALLGRSIRSNLGEKWQRLFFDAYGRKEVDQRRIEFYTMLDRFTRAHYRTHE